MNRFWVKGTWTGKEPESKEDRIVLLQLQAIDEHTESNGFGMQHIEEKLRLIYRAVNHPSGLDLIVAERKRQVEVEGCTNERDDEYENCELHDAAWCYMMHNIVGIPDPDYLPLDWPWDKKWWKPRDQKSNLIRAGALLMAEQDRLQRMINKIAAEIDTLNSQQEPED